MSFDIAILALFCAFIGFALGMIGKRALGLGLTVSIPLIPAALLFVWLAKSPTDDEGFLFGWWLTGLVMTAPLWLPAIICLFAGFLVGRRTLKS